MNYFVFNSFLWSFFLFSFLVNNPFDQVVIVPFEIAPELQTQEALPPYLQKGIVDPGVVTERIIHNNRVSPAGVIGFYGGSVQVSDNDGFMTFPLSSPAPDLLIITPKITPIWMIGNTVHHWELATTRYVVYECKKEKDASTGFVTWSIQEKNDLIKKRIIPLHAVVICGEPSDFSLHSLGRPIKESSQLIFPAVFIKNSGIKRFKFELFIPDVRRLFGSLSSTSKKQTETSYAQQVVSGKKASQQP